MLHGRPALLASAGVTRPGDMFGQVLPWLLVFLGIVVVGAIVVAIIRRRVWGRDGGAPDAGFTLHDLRSLHASGQISTEEFERAKSAMIAQVGGDTSENAAGEAEQSAPDA
ncbi:MAG: SHOCT domain-containing protein [Phycisphaerales bacterium]|nr:SHOCT domain-containing protein [Phycisphaerales bacterium]